MSVLLLPINPIGEWEQNFCRCPDGKSISEGSDNEATRFHRVDHQDDGANKDSNENSPQKGIPGVEKEELEAAAYCAELEKGGERFAKECGYWKVEECGDNDGEDREIDCSGAIHAVISELSANNGDPWIWPFTIGAGGRVNSRSADGCFAVPGASNGDVFRPTLPSTDGSGLLLALNGTDLHAVNGLTDGNGAVDRFPIRAAETTLTYEQRQSIAGSSNGLNPANLSCIAGRDSGKGKESYSNSASPEGASLHSGEGVYSLRSRS